jgi:rod shape-determining protein MreC
MNRFSNKVTITLLIFGCFVLLYYVGVLKIVDKFAFSILSKGQSRIVVEGNHFSQLQTQVGKSKLELSEEVRLLQQENNSLIVQTARLERLENENETLRKMLAFKNDELNSVVMADVVGKNYSILDKSFILSKGSNQNVQIGAPVIIDTGALVGIISQVNPYTSKVILTTDDDSAVLATIVGSNYSITGIAQGSTEARLQLNLIPKNVSLVPQQKIMTNGLQDRIPEGLYIGEISSIEQDENKIFNSALIEPPYSLENLSVVGIVITKE